MAKKQLNRNLVIALTLCLFAVMIVLSALMLRRLQQRDPKYYIELADIAAADGHWQQAAVFYQQAWNRSNDAKYLVEVGEMLLRDGDVQNAALAWRQALVSEPDLMEGHARQLGLLMRIARLYGTLDDWAAVRDAADAMLKVDVEKTPAQTAFARNARGLALIRLVSRGSDANEGLAELAMARQLAPETVDYALDLANELSGQGKTEEAETIHRELVARHADSGAQASAVRTAYARFLSARKRGDDAEAMFAEAVARAGDDASASREARLALAGLLTQKWADAKRDPERSDEADALFEKTAKSLKSIIGEDPDGFDAYLQLATLYRADQRHEAVVETCEQRIVRGLSRKGVEAGQLRVNMFTLMIYASEACVALGIQAGQDGAVADRDRWLSRAEQYVVDARGEAPTHPRVLSQSGRVKIARGQERAGLEDLRSADEGYRTFGTVNWENRLIRARVHLQLGESGAARQVLEEVMGAAIANRGTDPVFWNLYAQTLVQVGELDRALSIIDRVLVAIPDNTDAKRIKAAIYERQGKYAQAGPLEQEVSGSGTVRAILEAREATLAGNVDQAIATLKSAMEKDPGDARLVTALAQELTAAGRQDEAEEVVRNAIAIHPDDAVLNQLAISLRKDLTPDQRDDALRKLIESEQDPFKRALGLTGFYLRRNDAKATLTAVDEALRLLKEGGTASVQRTTDAQRAALLRTKMRAAAMVNNENSMTEARDEAARLNVDGSDGKSILGLYHMLRREFELAGQAFRAALTEQPTQVSSMILLGQCLQATGQTDEARDWYERASRINPSDATAHQGLALLAQMKGDREVFLRELAVCERLIPDDPWVREQVLIRTEEADPATAIARREQRLAEKPNDVSNIARLAALYEAVKQIDKADEMQETLLKLSPDDARTAALSAEYFRRTDRKERAIGIVRKYAETRPTPDSQANAEIVVANEYFRQGDLAATERTLLGAADRSQTLEVTQTLADFYFRQMNDARKALLWFDKAYEMARATNSPHLDAILERRIGCLLDRDINELDRARNDVAELRRRGDQSGRGLLLESEIHARAGEINEAVTSLSGYLAKRADDAYALYQRARYEVARGRTAAAIEDLERLKRSDPTAFGGEPRILLARLLERTGRKDLRIAELESLAKDTGQSPQVLQVLVEAYISQKRFSDAERIVTSQINQQAGSPDARWFFLRGRLSVEQNDAEKALADYRRGAEIDGQSPRAVLLVLDTFLRLARFADGITYYEGLGTRDEKDAGVVARFAQLLARAGRADQSVDVFRRAMALAAAAGAEAVAVVTESLEASFAPDDAVRLFESTAAPPALARANDRVIVRLLVLSGKFDDAVGRIDRLIASTDTDRERGALLHEKGDFHQLAGSAEQALRSYEEALKYDSENWVTLNNVAYLLSDKRGDNAQALAYAKKAVSKADNPYTLDTLGWIYAGLGQYDAAVAELSRAIRLNPDYALPYFHLGESHRRAGQFDEAREILTSGRRVAESAGDGELTALIDESLEKSNQKVTTP